MTRQDNLAPELLSMAGNWERARVGVSNGADAVFSGMPRFNARDAVTLNLPLSKRISVIKGKILSGGNINPATLVFRPTSPERKGPVTAAIRTILPPDPPNPGKRQIPAGRY